MSAPSTADYSFSLTRSFHPANTNTGSKSTDTWNTWSRHNQRSHRGSTVRGTEEKERDGSLVSGQQDNDGDEARPSSRKITGPLDPKRRSAFIASLDLLQHANEHTQYRSKVEAARMESLKKAIGKTQQSKEEGEGEGDGGSKQEVVSKKKGRGTTSSGLVEVRSKKRPSSATSFLFRGISTASTQADGGGGGLSSPISSPLVHEETSAASFVWEPTAGSASGAEGTGSSFSSFRSRPAAAASKKDSSAQKRQLRRPASASAHRTKKEKVTMTHLDCVRLMDGSLDNFIAHHDMLYPHEGRLQHPSVVQLLEGEENIGPRSISTTDAGKGQRKGDEEGQQEEARRMMKALWEQKLNISQEQSSSIFSAFRRKQREGRHAGGMMDDSDDDDEGAKQRSHDQTTKEMVRKLVQRHMSRLRQEEQLQEDEEEDELRLPDETRTFAERFIGRSILADRRKVPAAPRGAGIPIVPITPPHSTAPGPQEQEGTVPRRASTPTFLQRSTSGKQQQRRRGQEERIPKGNTLRREDIEAFLRSSSSGVRTPVALCGSTILNQSGGQSSSGEPPALGATATLTFSHLSVDLLDTVASFHTPLLDECKEELEADEEAARLVDGGALATEPSFASQVQSGVFQRKAQEKRANLRRQQEAWRRKEEKEKAAQEEAEAKAKEKAELEALVDYSTYRKLQGRSGSPPKTDGELQGIIAAALHPVARESSASYGGSPSMLTRSTGGEGDEERRWQREGNISPFDYDEHLKALRGSAATEEQRTGSSPPHRPTSAVATSHPPRGERRPKAMVLVEEDQQPTTTVSSAPQSPIRDPQEALRSFDSRNDQQQEEQKQQPEQITGFGDEGRILLPTAAQKKENEKTNAREKKQGAAGGVTGTTMASRKGRVSPSSDDESKKATATPPLSPSSAVGLSQWEGESTSTGTPTTAALRRNKKSSRLPPTPLSQPSSRSSGRPMGAGSPAAGSPAMPSSSSQGGMSRGAAEDLPKSTRKGDREREVLLSMELEKFGKYKWAPELICNPFTTSRQVFHTNYLNELRDSFTGKVPKPNPKPDLNPPTLKWALVVSVGFHEDPTLGYHPQATQDGILLAETLNSLGYTVRHLSTDALEKKRNASGPCRPSDSAGSHWLINSMLAGTTGKDTLGSSSSKPLSFEEQLQQSALRAEKKTEEGDEEDEEEAGEEYFLPTKANIARELSRAAKYYEAKHLASFMMFVVGPGTIRNAMEYSDHPVKLLCCYDSKPNAFASFFPVEALVAMKLPNTLVAGDFGAMHPSHGLGFVASDAVGGKLEFQYPSLQGFLEVLGGKWGTLASLLVRGFRGKASRDLRITPNNINVFIAYRLMAQRWKLYTSATPLQSGNNDLVDRPTLFRQREDMRAFRQSKRRGLACFRMYGVIGEHSAKNLTTVSSQLLTKIRHSSAIHLGGATSSATSGAVGGSRSATMMNLASNQVQISSVLSSGVLYFVFRTKDVYSMAIVEAEGHCRRHISGVTVTREPSFLRLVIQHPKPQMLDSIAVLKDYIKSKSLCASVLVGVEVSITASKRAGRKLDWAMRVGHLAPLIHVSYSEVDRNQLHRIYSAILLQSYVRRFRVQKRFKTALRLMKERSQVVQDVYSAWKAEWLSMVNSLYRQLANCVDEEEANERAAIAEWQRNSLAEEWQDVRKTYTRVVLLSRGRYLFVRPFNVLDRRRRMSAVSSSEVPFRFISHFREELFTDPCAADNCPLGTLTQSIQSFLSSLPREEQSGVEEFLSPPSTPIGGGTGSGSGSGGLLSSPLFVGSPAVATARSRSSQAAGDSPSSSALAPPRKLPEFIAMPSQLESSCSVVRSRAEIAAWEESSWFFLRCEFERKRVEFSEKEAFKRFLGILNIPADVQNGVRELLKQQHMELLAIVAEARHHLIIPGTKVPQQPHVIHW